MGKRIFTEAQIKELLQNKNVERCSTKSITYSKEFRVEAIRLYEEEGLPSREIFAQAGFDLQLIGEENPNRRLKAWRRIVRKRGINRLLMEGRGSSKGLGKGRPRINGLSDSEKIKRLELTVAYLKAENDFLAKLRAKRVE